MNTFDIELAQEHRRRLLEVQKVKRFEREYNVFLLGLLVVMAGIFTVLGLFLPALMAKAHFIF